jgi:hypothetical protein
VLTNAPPPCQVKEQDNDHDEQVNNINKIEKGVLDGSIPSAVADSGATSSVRTKRDRNRKAFTPIGRKSDKVFRMPNGKVGEASNLDELHHDVRHPAKDVHIVPGIEHDSLLSIPKFVDANYVAIFDKTKSTSTMPTKQSSPSLAAKYSVGGNVNRPSSGAYPSPRLLKMKTPTQSSAIDAQQNSSQTGHHQSKRSTMCTTENLAQACAILPCCSGIPNQTIVAQGNQKQTVPILAGPHMGGDQQTLPRVPRDLKRPRMQDEKRPAINKDISNKRQGKQ